MEVSTCTKKRSKWFYTQLEVLVQKMQQQVLVLFFTQHMYASLKRNFRKATSDLKSFTTSEGFRMFASETCMEKTGFFIFMEQLSTVSVCVFFSLSDNCLRQM